MSKNLGMILQRIPDQIVGHPEKIFVKAHFFFYAL
jgi:hypothetical protein